MWCLSNFSRQPAAGFGKQLLSQSLLKSIKSKGNVGIPTRSNAWTSRQFSHQSKCTSTISNAKKGRSILLSLGLVTGGCTTVYLTAKRLQKRKESCTQQSTGLLGVGSFSASCLEKNTDSGDEGKVHGVSAQRFDSAIRKSRDFLQRIKVNRIRLDKEGGWLYNFIFINYLMICHNIQ